ncbi:MAG: hypothetical protein M0Z92_08055 [Actinomycetota bacterium]|nr:hypothetical protein [Actinomycetota bacterium]
MQIAESATATDASASARYLSPRNRRLLATNAFPALLILLALIFSALQISGTSIGILNPPGHNSNLIAGSPKAIRSDEWSVSTPLTIASARQHFSERLYDGAGSHNTSVVLDVPNNSWTTIFKPYNWPFFVLPLANAYALKWWLLFLFLVLPTYWLALLLTRKVSAAILVSLGMSLSPFFAWWYEAGALDSVGFMVAIMLLVLLVLRNAERRISYLYAGLLAYFLVAFTILLYPPFQIPLAYTAAAFLLPFVIRDLVLVSDQKRARRFALLGGAVVAAIVILVGYMQSEIPTITKIVNTVYPGNRIAVGATANILQLFSPWVGIFIASHPTAIAANSNASEISSFFLLAPVLFFFTPLAGKWRRSRTYGASQFLIALTMIALLAWMYVGFPAPIATLTLLDRVTSQRAIVGVGLASWLLILLFIADFEFSKGTSAEETAPSARAAWPRVALGVATFGLVIGYGARQMQLTYPALGVSMYLVGIFVVLVLIGLILLVKARYIVASVFLLPVLALQAVTVNPLYRGLSPLVNPTLQTNVDKIERLVPALPSRTPPGWLVVGPPIAFLSMIGTGAYVFNATSQYPDISAWKVIDPSGGSESIWNRYAHVVYQPAANTALILSNPSPDTVIVSGSPCSPAFAKLDIRFLLTQSPLNYSCLTNVTTGGLKGLGYLAYEIS